MALLDQYVMLDFRDMVADFDKRGETIEDEFLKRLKRSNNLGFWAFVAGVIALLFSEMSVGLTLLVLFLYWSQQSAIFHTEMMMTRYARIVAHLNAKAPLVSRRDDTAPGNAS